MRFSASRPLRAMVNRRAARLEDARQREDVPHVVLDDQDRPALEQLVALACGAQHPLRRRRQIRFDLVQEQRHLVEQPFGRTRALDDHRARVAAQTLFVLARRRAAGIDDRRAETSSAPWRSSSRVNRITAAGREASDRARRSRSCVGRRRSSASAAEPTPSSSTPSICSRSLRLSLLRRRPRRGARAAGGARTALRACGWRLTSSSRVDRLQRVTDGAELERGLACCR